MKGDVYDKFFRRINGLLKSSDLNVEVSLIRVDEDDIISINICLQDLYTGSIYYLGPAMDLDMTIGRAQSGKSCHVVATRAEINEMLVHEIITS